MSLESMERNGLETHIGKLVMTQGDLSYPLEKSSSGHLVLNISPTLRGRPDEYAVKNILNAEVDLTISPDSNPQVFVLAELLRVLLG